MTTREQIPARRLTEALADVVRHARLPGADQIEAGTGIRVDAAGAVILARLDPEPGVRLSELAAGLGLDLSTVSRQIPPLEDAGFVTRRPDPDDRRASLVHLTPAGVDASRRIAAYRTRLVSQLVADWTAADVDHLAALLDRLATALVEQRRP